MQLPQKIERLGPAVVEPVAGRVVGTIFAQRDPAFDGCVGGHPGTPEPHGHPVGGLFGHLPAKRHCPPFAVVWVGFPRRAGGGVVGKELVPSSAEPVVVGSPIVGWPRFDTRVLPENFAVDNFVEERPEFASQFGEQHQPEMAVFKHKGAQASVMPVGVEMDR